MRQLLLSLLQRLHTTVFVTARPSGILNLALSNGANEKCIGAYLFRRRSVMRSRTYPHRHRPQRQRSQRRRRRRQHHKHLRHRRRRPMANFRPMRT